MVKTLLDCCLYRYRAKNIMNKKTTDVILFLIIGAVSPYIFTYIISYFYGILFVEFLNSKSNFLLIGVAATFSCSMMLHTPLGYFFPGTFILAWLSYILIFFVITSVGMLLSESPIETIRMFWKSNNTWFFLIFGVFFVWVGRRIRSLRARNST